MSKQPAVGIVAVGRDDTAGRRRGGGGRGLGRTAREVEGRAGDVAVGIGDRDHVAPGVVGIGGGPAERSQAVTLDGRQAIAELVVGVARDRDDRVGDDNGQQVAGAIVGEGRHQPVRVSDPDRFVEGRIVHRRGHQGLHRVRDGLVVARRLGDVAVEVVLVGDAVAGREILFRY